ncbi:MAG: Lrp/AsnC family transcriptional regulator [Lentisphaerae bacterium]|nr:Lrp/AsnC family transcriptional regulator [Lentisphaerota bacterium]
MNSTDTRQALLRLLRHNARMPSTEMAARLELTREQVDDAIAAMEAEGIIMGYSAIIDEDKAPSNGTVRAIIEVEVQPERDGGFDNVAMALARFPEVHAVHLVSGRYDLRLEVVGQSLQDVARFVASKLASQDGVKATATHFILKKYKEAGVELREEGPYERLKIVP